MNSAASRAACFAALLELASMHFVAAVGQSITGGKHHKVASLVDTAAYLVLKSPEGSKLEL